jgi:GH24 family phage-related lysozyme (muramidase)
MKMNKVGLDLVKHFEGWRSDAYLDPVGIWTIGWGHTGPDVHRGQTISVEQGEAILKADLAKHEAFVTKVVTRKINDSQFSALVSFAFNVGNGSLASSTLLRRLNAGDVPGAGKEFLRWVFGTVNGVKVELPGLVRRRRAESALFLGEAVDLDGPRMEVAPAEPEAEDLAVMAAGAPTVALALLGGDRDRAISIQKALTAAGYLDPPADGEFGPASHWALREFCQREGLRLDGGFTTEIAARLLAPHSPLPQPAAGGIWFDAVIAAMQTRGHWICRHPDCVNIVYLEGAGPDGQLNDDRPNAFNDLRCVFRLGAGGVPSIRVWEGTTEPGTFWTQNPMSVKGAARIAFGQYKSWIVGTHHAGRPGAHEALVQVKDVSVFRDFNRDFKRTGDEIETGLFGINQHWGYDAPRNDLGNTSAGCLVGRSREGHREFMEVVKSDARYIANGAYRFITTILPGDEILVSA